MKDNLNHARNALQMQRMKEAQEKGICCFCREFFEEYHTAPISYENEHWLVTRNDFPYEGATEHFLLVAKRHVFTPQALSPLEWKCLQDALNTVSRLVPGGAFLMRFGETSYTGGTMAHLHAHVIVGSSGEKGDEHLTAIVGYKDTKTTS